MAPNVLAWGAAGAPPPTSQGDVVTDPASNLMQTFDGTSFKAPRQYIDLNQNGLTPGQFAVTSPIFVVPNDGSQWVVDSPATAFVGTASTSGAFKLQATASGTAPGSGTDQQGTTIATNALTNQFVNGVSLIAAPTIMTAGMHLDIVWSGTTTGLANCTIVVPIRRVK